MPLQHPSAPLPRRSPLFTLASMAFACATLASVVACNKTPPAGMAGPAGQMPAPEVNIVKVKAQDLPQTYEYVGQTAGSNEAEVRARVTGVLQARSYVEGSKVQKDQLLFEIDPGTFATQKTNAEAAMAVAQARLNQAQREFQRLAPLLTEKAVSQKEVDDAKSTFEIAQASFKQAQAQFAEAKLNMDYTRVKAPFTGVAGKASKSIGNMVTPSDGVLTTMLQTDPMYVNFSLTESDYLKLMREVAQNKILLPGKRASDGSLPFDVKLKLADGSIFGTSGKMNFSSEKINPTTASIEARAQVANPEGVLRPGQFVRVMLQGAVRPHAISVPQRAVLDGPAGKMVFVVTADNKLAPRPVELDAWNQGDWIVTKGLADGEQVMVDGFIKAHKPGMLVKPVLLSAALANPKEPAQAAKTASTPATASSSASH